MTTVSNDDLGHDADVDEEEVTEVTSEDREQRESILGELRSTFSESVLDATEVFDVEPRPGVAIRYRYVGGKVVNSISPKLKGVQDPSVHATYAACETLMACCDEIVVYGASGKLLPLIDPTPEHPDPIRFDARLAEVLGLPATTKPRKLVLSLFKQNEWAIRQQAQQVSDWLSRTGAAAREDLAGK